MRNMTVTAWPAAGSSRGGPVGKVDPQLSQLWISSHGCAFGTSEEKPYSVSKGAGGSILASAAGSTPAPRVVCMSRDAHLSGDDDSRPRILVILFGTLEFDGRVQRMVEVLNLLDARVWLVDIAPEKVLTTADCPGLKRISIPLPKRPGRVGRHLRLLLAAIREARRIRPDVVVGADYFAAPASLLAARLTGAALIYDAHELLVPGDSRMSARHRFWYYLERLVVRRSDRVLAANEERARLMSEHYGLAKLPAVMRNIPPEREPAWTEAEVLAAFPALTRRSPDEKIVLYQGHVSVSRGLGRFVEAFHHLPEEYRLVVVGDGPDLERLKAAAQPLTAAGRFTAVGAVPNRVIGSVTRLADVGIITYPFKGLNNLYCAPNKIFEYAQAGVPVVATDQPPLRRMVDGYQIGVCITETDGPEVIAAAIETVARRGRESFAPWLMRFCSEHRWETEAKRLADELRPVLVSRLGKHDLARSPE